MSDEAFHEIQLNGKQLVFLFMAATVVAVVIFLCGVMVGRGVQSPRLLAAAATPADLVDPTSASPVTAPTATDAPLTTQETLTYSEHLESATPPVESLTSRVDSPPAVVEPVVEPPVERPRQPATETPRMSTPQPQPTAAEFAEPPGRGLVVQVAAVAKRAEAETIARRLSAKGYPVFITSNGANMFRVRIGKYPNAREAEAVGARLEKEEQFRPWITR
jgi:cell division septation protein DedD